jgi:hypothetical protein
MLYTTLHFQIYLDIFMQLQAKKKLHMNGNFHNEFQLQQIPVEI